METHGPDMSIRKWQLNQYFMLAGMVGCIPNCIPEYNQVMAKWNAHQYDNEIIWIKI